MGGERIQGNGDGVLIIKCRGTRPMYLTMLSGMSDNDLTPVHSPQCRSNALHGWDGAGIDMARTAEYCIVVYMLEISG